MSLFFQIIVLNRLHWNGHTVNLGIFARVLFSRNFAHATFRVNKTLAKWLNNSVVY